jgi:hypothetical protein
MRGRWLRRGIKIVLMVLVAAAALSFVFMSLWNWLMPALFGWHSISFFQAIGLLILSRLLFGGFRGRGGGGGHWRRRWSDRWEKMTPEEKEKFRSGMLNRCGHLRTPEAAREV